jgi:hypothetical protein
MRRSVAWFAAAVLMVVSPARAANPPGVDWSATLTNAAIGSSVCLSPNGGYVVTGTTPLGNPVVCNVYIAKVNALGTLEWEHGYGSRGQDEGFHVEPTTDGGYIISGWTSRPGVALLLKTDASGQFVWQQTYDGPRPVDGNCVVAAPSAGGYFVICDASDDYAAVVIRTGPTGIEIHRRAMANPASNRTARGGVLCSDGGCLIAGWTDSCGISSSPESPNDVYYAKVGADGSSLQWQKVHGGTGDDMAYAVTDALDGGYALAGTTTSQPDGFNHFYLLRVNSLGDVLWDSTYASSNDAIAYSICRTSDGGYALAGVKGNMPYVMRTNISGHMLWEKTLEGHSGQASAVRQTPDGGFVVVGSHIGGVAELFLTKLLPETKR